MKMPTLPVGFWWLINRLVDIVDDILNTRALLAAGSLLGFYFIAYQVIQRLSNPPASELFTVLNLAALPVTGATAYYFGREAGKREAAKEAEVPPANRGTP